MIPDHLRLPHHVTAQAVDEQLPDASLMLLKLAVGSESKVFTHVVRSRCEGIMRRPLRRAITWPDFSALDAEPCCSFATSL